MLAIIEADDVAHGPLELLFTIDEETGMTGAAGLGPDMLKGKLLVNVDSEDEGELTIGCAGGGDSHLQLPVGRVQTPAGSKGLAVRISGLKGGHSGVDIHLQRGNAVKLLARALQAAALERPFHLAGIRGGNAHNAIPREAGATLTVAAADLDGFRHAARVELEAVREEYRPADPGLEFEIAETDLPPQVWDAATTSKVVALISALPHGVMSMSYDVPGLVETSTNLAVVGESDDDFKIMMSSRSSVASALSALRRRIRSTGSLAGAEVEEDEGYPGWKPDPQSRLLEIVKQVHEEVAGTMPKVVAIHAGLECGIIGDKYPGMDMISFGPQIEFPHSPDERIKIDSVATFYKLLTTTLERLA
jgi:dipeptidase D